MTKLAILVIALIFAGCSTTSPSLSDASASKKDEIAVKKEDSAVKKDEAPAPVVVAASKAVATTASSIDTVAIAKLAAEIQKIHPETSAETANKLATEIQKLHNESVYFDFDEYAIKPEFLDAVKKQAENMTNNKSTVVVLEGNCDERGSAAYNLALGEKRSSSVKKVMVTLSVPAEKIKVVTYGNTKPKLECHEEKCWHENRRVDFVFSQK